MPRSEGNPVNTSGSLPAPGTQAPDFTLVGGDLSEKSLADFAGKKKVIPINPSFDTGVCQATARKFNQALGERGGVVSLAGSGELPFAQKRVCEGEALSHVVALSSFRPSFAKDHGVQLVDGPLRGLTARAVVVLDASNRVLAAELVPEISQEPDYAPAIAALAR